MKLALNIFLFILIIILVYFLIGSIKEPIQFKAEKERREAAVIQKLIEIRKAQELYRGVTGQFAANFDTLSEVLKRDKFRIIKVIGDPDDPSGQAVTYDTLYKPAIDSVKNLGLMLDSLKFVPYGNGATFDIKADTITYQSTMVNVVEVGVSRKAFMGKYADTRFSKYDNSYDPTKVIKFGNMNAPNIAGNWE
jgi:hypothetical protein